MISELYRLVPQHLLYWHLSGQITSDEICEMSLFIGEQADVNASHKVHIIIEGNGITQIDYGNKRARDAFHTLANQRWMGKVAVFIRNYPIQVKLNALSGAFGLNWHNVASMQDAIRFLKTHDNQIQNVPALSPKLRIERVVKF
jgi:hypothetical protein